MYSPYDFNQSVAHRADYVEERLKAGMPVVALACEPGVLLFTVKRTQRKVFEIYDQIIYSAIGNQADVEAVRLAAIDFCHQEGFARSPDDVSLQRLVGFAISPPLKRAFGDPMTTPNVLRAVFAEMGKTPQDDQFFVLNYDGEFSTHSGYAVAAPTDEAESAMLGILANAPQDLTLAAALELAATAWQAGMDEKGENGEARESGLWHGGDLEAGLLQRHTPRESKFRLLQPQELQAVSGKE
jgi:proteasome alpha subunit